MGAWIVFFVATVVGSGLYAFAWKERRSVESAARRSLLYVEFIRLVLAVAGIALIAGLMVFVVADSLFDIA